MKHICYNQAQRRSNKTKQRLITPQEIHKAGGLLSDLSRVLGCLGPSYCLAWIELIRTRLPPPETKLSRNRKST
ncbi:unnamed protein product [Clavelina lepadiformis]|uniref:Uncharacterized protein n=1 Tax=Clavelina lepadiformis TaxID=159417 RepID=A0ABP0G5P9_CLALP